MKAMQRLLTMTCLIIVAAGCQNEGGGSPAEARRSAAIPAVELVVTRVIWEAPSGAGDPSQVELGWLEADGSVTPLPLTEPVVAWVAWGHEAVVTDRDGDLWTVDRDGRRGQLGQDVVGRPAVSDDGELLAYVVRDDLHGEVRVRRRIGGPRVVARDLGSAGALRFAPEGHHLLFVSSWPGRVAGLFAADLDGGQARCLTNCDLNVGQPWGDDFVPLPSGPESLMFEGDQVSWEAEGRVVARRYRGSAEVGGAP
jgi:hypothetical protein